MAEQPRRFAVYPQPYRIFHPISGRPCFTGPDGEGGYGTPAIGSDTWIMPDGTPVWFYPGQHVDAGNRVALGLDRFCPGAPTIGYAGAFQAAKRQGASDGQADVAAAISIAESSATWCVHNLNFGTGDDSIGLWQINLMAHAEYRAINLYNIDANARAMREVSGNFTNWRPWSTFLSGEYRQYLHGANPSQAIPPPPPPPPRSSGGPVESLVDGLVGNVPDIPLIGGAVRDGIRAMLHPLAHAIDAGINAVADAVTGAVHAAESLFNDAEHFAQRIVDDARQLAFDVAHVVEHEAAGWVQLAENLAARGIHDVAALAQQLAQTAIHDAETLYNDAVRLAEAGVRDAEHLAQAVATEVLHDAETLYNDAVRLAEAGVRDAEHLAQAVATEVLHDAESLYNDAVRLAEAGVRDAERLAKDAVDGLIRDVIDPLLRQVEHLAGELPDDVLGAVRLLVKIVRWVEWLATQSFDQFDELIHDTVALAEGDVIELLPRGLGQAERVALPRVAGWLR